MSNTLEAIELVAVFVVPVLIYLDLLRLRKRGVVVNPGSVAGKYALWTIGGPWALAFALILAASFTGLSMRFPITDTIIDAVGSLSVIMPIAGVLWYLIFYRSKIVTVPLADVTGAAPVAENSSGFFVGMLVWPVIGILLFVLLIIFLFTGELLGWKIYP
jgi:hypothetical protein